jgi:hypothetical protein
LSKIQILIKKSEIPKKKKDFEAYSDFIREIGELSNEYYDILTPTNFAYDKIQPLLHDYNVQNELKKLNQIYDLEIALKIILGAKLRKDSINPFSYCYNNLPVSLNVLDPNDPKFYSILKCMNNTNEYSNSTTIIKNIFKISQQVIQLLLKSVLIY